VRGRLLAYAGVGESITLSSPLPNSDSMRAKPGQRRENAYPCGLDGICVREAQEHRAGTDVKRPRPVGVQGFKSPPPHHLDTLRIFDSNLPARTIVPVQNGVAKTLDD